MNSESILQVTRLAPSPTGALHLGNARTFLVNWALARQNDWKIVLRIEDLDGPRVKPEAIEGTIEILKWLGMDWDIGPIVQSRDLAPYRAAMKQLAGAGLAYPCELTRAQIEAAASAPQEGTGESVFPASLRPDLRAREFDDEMTNWRLVVPDEVVRFDDEFAGAQSRNPVASVGDFVVWTKRGQPSYQLAVVVDDARQGVTQIVRGDDLIDSAARQLLLYRALGLVRLPRYTHLPLVVGEDGKRLAKRHGDTRLDSYRAAGVSAERVIGLTARWCGIMHGRPRSSQERGLAEPSPRHEEQDAAEFRDRLDLRSIPRSQVVFTQEDDRWLRE